MYQLKVHGRVITTSDHILSIPEIIQALRAENVLDSYDMLTVIERSHYQLDWVEPIQIQILKILGTDFVAGNKITAIRLVRAVTDLGLREAKDTVEGFCG